jgi:hypothetical protein
VLRETTVCRAEACVCLLLHYLTKLFVFVRGSPGFFFEGTRRGFVRFGFMQHSKNRTWTMHRE